MKTNATSKATDAKPADYERLNPSHGEHMKLLASGHPGGTISFAPAGVGVVFGASDTSQLRETYADVDADALLANCSHRLFKAD